MCSSAVGFTSLQVDLN